MRNFDHLDVTTVEAACAALARFEGRARLNAGGTDLLSLLKTDVASPYPELLINIKPIAGLSDIREENGLLRIGALVRLDALAASPLLNQKYGVLAKAAKSVAGPQIRHMATLGGNLCQDIRCWYYRYPLNIGGPITCLRKGSGPCLAVKGDNRYHAIMGAKKCFAVCPSDTAVALAALDGRLRLTGPDGERLVPATDFYHSTGNVLGPHELVHDIEVPEANPDRRHAFIKFTLRKPIDFAIISVASVLTLEENRCIDARIVLGAVGPGPVRASDAETILIGKPVTRETAAAAAEAALAGAKPLSKNAYKVEVAKVLVERAIMEK